MSFIAFSGITHSFDQRDIFNDFSLSVERGEKLQITSPSGRGKTTLFRMLLGFVEPRGGKILVDGIEVTEESIVDVRRRAAYLSQDIDFRDGNTEEIITEIVNFHHNKHLGVSLDDIKREAEDLELSPVIWTRGTSKLSGGERQRLGIALALSLKREIFLFDEPTSALDAKMKKKVRDRVLESDGTFLIISHDSIWKHKSIRTVSW